MQRERPSWDDFYMFAAVWAATRSSCLHLQTGATIVKDMRVIASGYNGAPPRVKNCLDRGCRKEEKGVGFEDKGKGVCRAIHAEANAMDQIARENLKGTTIYSLYLPCSACAKEIVGSGIERVVYAKNYEERDCLTKELFAEAGVKLEQLELDIEKCFNMIREAYGLKKNKKKK